MPVKSDADSDHKRWSISGLQGIPCLGTCMGSARGLAKTQLLAESWTVVAQQYEKRLAPLFQPWLDQLVGALAAENVPEGSVIVPACGPGESSEPRHPRLLLPKRSFA